MLTRRLLTSGVVLTVAVVAVALALLAGGVPVPGLSDLVSSSSGTCTAAPGTREQDVDSDDSAEYPWTRTPGRPAVVYFETGSLPPRYARFVEQGAAAWSRGPCVRAVAVARCPAGAHCSSVAVAPGRGDDGDTDGESEGTENGTIRVGNALSLYTSLLDLSTDNGAQVTVTHEMGHALGLRHRNADGLMNADTDDDTDAQPDAVDYGNLLAIYGTPDG